MSGFLKAICYQAAGTAVTLGRAVEKELLVSGPVFLQTEIVSLEGVILVQAANPMGNFYIQANSADSGAVLPELDLKEFGMPFFFIKKNWGK